MMEVALAIELEREIELAIKLWLGMIIVEVGEGKYTSI